MSPKKKNPKDFADWHLWTEVTKSVSPLKTAQHKNVLRVQPAELPETLESKPTRKSKTPTTNWAPLATHIHHEQQHVPHFNSVVAPTKPDKTMDQKLRRKIARGRVMIDATLDLHGMRQHEARSALHHFVGAAFRRGDRNVLVITGKGVKRTGYAEFEQKGVLRHAVPNWLKEPSLMHMVSGVDGAAQNHGGAGALYIRLKKIGK